MPFESFPFLIGWELTLDCNLRCRHCASAAGVARKRELGLEEALAICDQFPDLLVQEVDFTGGEPLVRPDWMTIVARLARLQICTRMVTNGILLGPKTVGQIADSGLASLAISVDGLEPTHDYIRGHEGLFRSVRSSIERVLKQGIPLTVITTVNALNVGQLAAMLEMLSSMGVRNWQMQPLFPLGRGKETDELRLTEDQYLQFGQFVRDQTDEYDRTGVRIIPGDSFGYFTELDQRMPPWRGCPAGQVSCGITSEGKVKPCLSMPDDLVQGDLRQQDLWTIWFRPDAFAFNRRDRGELGPNCRGCENAQQCGGGCSAMSLGATGCFHNDPYCFYRIVRGGSSRAEVPTAFASFRTVMNAPDA